MLFLVISPASEASLAACRGFSGLLFPQDGVLSQEGHHICSSLYASRQDYVVASSVANMAVSKEQTFG